MNKSTLDKVIDAARQTRIGLLQSVQEQDLRALINAVYPIIHMRAVDDILADLRATDGIMGQHTVADMIADHYGRPN